MSTAPLDHLFDDRNKYADSLCGLRALWLALAMAHYRSDSGRDVEDLRDLVPKYLDRLPESPYIGGAFTYRVAVGDSVLYENHVDQGRPPRRSEPGQAVVWDTSRPELLTFVPLPSRK